MRQILWRIPKARTIVDLESALKVRNLEQRVINERPRYPIAVLDDAEFHPLENLRRHHYNITHFREIEAVSALEGFRIILCALIGVGTMLDPTLQGAHVIKEVKKSYPEKFVIAYTGGTQNDLIQSAIFFADRFLKKDSTIAIWCEELDKAISSVGDPVFAWRRYTHRILDAGVTPYQLMVLEDAFVKGVLSGGDQYKANLSKQVESLQLSADVRAIIRSLIASTIFHALLA